ncbi:MAG: methylisocitrate lyase [Candidatus Thermoplasmatota archaeon]|jgi:methylisocitrate lyase|nr:methylisocitrate lyase [Candidatus Thermoplasmatota archaeon]
MSIIRDNHNLGPDELRKQLKNGFITAAGVYSGITGIQAERAGFKTLYLSGSGVAGVMGIPDLSFTTLTELADETRKITSVTKSPLIVDADTGFGEPLNVSRTVRILEEAGASAIHIEDQQLPKKCGHLSGKKLVDAVDMIHKLRAAVKSRVNESFCIIARTDARSVNGIDDAISRAALYAENGADIIFTEALESREEFMKFRREIKIPLLANMTEFGRSPLLSVKDLKEIGYNAVIFPLTAFRTALKSTKNAYERLYSDGTQKDIINNMMSRDEYYDLIGYYDYEREDKEIFGEKI